MIEMEQLSVEGALTDCADVCSLDWLQGLGVVVYLPAFRVLM